MHIRQWLFFTIALLLPILTWAEYKPARTAALPGTVALTFDDGPAPFSTARVLEILKRYQIKATFFVVGNYVLKNPLILQKVELEGHVIANHSFTHSLLTKLNDERLHGEIVNTQKVIFLVTGKTPHCMRYPYNASTPRVRAAIRAEGITPIGLTLDSEDYRTPGVNRIVQNVLSRVKSGDVILFHDGYAHREETIAALPKIIEGIKQKGLGFSQVCGENE